MAIVAPSSPSDLTQARRSVIACGLPGRHVAARHNETLDEDVVLIRTPRLQPDRRLACILTASQRYSFEVAFSQPDQQGDFDRRYLGLRDLPEQRAARQYFADRGLLKDVPMFDPTHEPLSAFAGRLARFCAVVPAVLVAAGKWRLTVDHTRWEAMSTDQPTCLLNAVNASNLYDQNVSFDFGGMQRPSREFTSPPAIP